MTETGRKQWFVQIIRRSAPSIFQTPAVQQFYSVFQEN